MGGSDRMTLPADLDERDGAESPSDEVLARAIVSLAEKHDVDVPDADSVAELERRVDDLAAERRSDVDGEVDRLQADVERLRGDLDEQITDVRERVIQVLEKAEAKAPENHSHPSLARRLEELNEELDDLAARVDRLDRRVAEGVERVQDALADEDSDREEKLTTLAGALVRAQRRIDDLEADRSRRTAVTELTATANRHGITAAACGNCEETVQIGLLNAPRCPHCGSPFESIAPKSGFFGADRLTVGERPAIEGDTTEPSAADGPFEEQR